MLDVHPPHHAATTWREFLIHIATICIGLLIAIALEQAVEAMHHAHQRRELIEDLRSECQHNKPVLEEAAAAYRARANWELQATAALMQATPENGYVTLTLPEMPTQVEPHAPSQAVWSVARANGKVALLPENLAEIYDRVDHQGQEFLLANRKVNDARNDVIALAALYGAHINPGKLVHLPAEARQAIAAALARVASANRSAYVWVLYWGAADDAELDNVQTRDAISPYLDRALHTSQRAEVN